MLDPRTAVVVHAPAAVFVWCGKRAHAAYAPAAHAWAARLVKFEGAPAATAVAQGEEPALFWEALGGGDSEQARAACVSARVRVRACVRACVRASVRAYSVVQAVVRRDDHERVLLKLRAKRAAAEQPAQRRVEEAGASV